MFSPYRNWISWRNIVSPPWRQIRVTVSAVTAVTLRRLPCKWFSGAWKQCQRVWMFPASVTFTPCQTTKLSVFLHHVVTFIAFSLTKYFLRQQSSSHDPYIITVNSSNMAPLKERRKQRLHLRSPLLLDLPDSHPLWHKTHQGAWGGLSLDWGWLRPWLHQS